MAFGIRNKTRVVDAWRLWRSQHAKRWYYAVASLLLSGLGQHAVGRRVRGLIWAYLPALLMVVFLVSGVSIFLFASFCLGLFSGAFLMLIPFSFFDWFPGIMSPVFWFGAFAKFLCVTDVWMVKRKEPVGRLSGSTILLYAMPQFVAPLVFCILFFVATISGVHAFDGLPQEIYVGSRGIGRALLRGDAVIVRNAGALHVLRVAALPGEDVELEVETNGNVQYRVIGRPIDSWKKSDEFCAWLKNDGSFLACHTYLESQNGNVWRFALPVDFATLRIAPQSDRFRVQEGEVFLVSDLRNVMVQPAWLRVPMTAVVGRPQWVLWSESTSGSVHWHRIGRRSE